VAEESRVPLYMLSAGDLGTTPETVESALNNALECCQLWDAVLLLDEADVFLESRDSNSLERNELVSSASAQVVSRCNSPKVIPHILTFA
jgi:hypothetical protein